ncbi:hypothetical protein NDU88_007769 [Pleurodeles waltl]|uniref:Uncharacterized protein n=1 Tax=Pleurodeles waltl TaxID=8319 RepID=A0AAV7NYC5_PLEWA|nr:hypothetical protein NDU88_007769 [Pleurodeles waltl]
MLRARFTADVSRCEQACNRLKPDPRIPRSACSQRGAESWELGARISGGWRRKGSHGDPCLPSAAQADPKLGQSSFTCPEHPIDGLCLDLPLGSSAPLSCSAPKLLAAESAIAYLFGMGSNGGSI